MASKLVYYASWLAAVLTTAATAYWIVVVVDGNYCWSAFAFTIGMAMPLGAGIFLFGLIPSVHLYLQSRQCRDWMSMILMGSAFGILLVEVIVINFVIPQRGE